MRCSDIDITKLPRKLPSQPSYNMYTYCFERETNNDIIKVVKGSKGGLGKVKAYINGKQAKPIYKGQYVCLGEFRRFLEGNHKADRNYNYGFVVTELSRPNARLSNEYQDKYYTIVRKMGMVSPLTTKRDFKNMITVVDATKHSMVYLYTVLSIVRAMRDDVEFVKHFVDAVYKYGIDPYAAYLGMSLLAHNSGHHIIDRPYSFGLIEWDEINLSLDWLCGMYRLFKRKEHLRLPTIADAGHKGFKVHNTLKAVGDRYRCCNISAAALLKYGNTLAASVKRTYNKSKSKSTLALCRKALRKYNV